MLENCIHWPTVGSSVLSISQPIGDTRYHCGVLPKMFFSRFGRSATVLEFHLPINWVGCCWGSLVLNADVFAAVVMLIMGLPKLQLMARIPLLICCVAKSSKGNGKLIKVKQWLPVKKKVRKNKRSLICYRMLPLSKSLARNSIFQRVFLQPRLRLVAYY